LKPSGALTGFPHDLLKPFDWRRHEDPRILPEGVRQVLSKYKVDYVQFALRVYGEPKVWNEKRLTSSAEKSPARGSLITKFITSNPCNLP
jgi:hypothetical protein